MTSTPRSTEPTSRPTDPSNDPAGDPAAGAAAGAAGTVDGQPGAPDTADTADALEAPGAPGATRPGGVLRWVALGDSFSAGQGGSRSTTAAAPIGDRGPATGSATGPAGSDRCLRAEPDSYARRAEGLLAASSPAVELSVAACGGALIADVLEQQAPQAQGADVVTLTVGGNDAGFFELTSRCLGRDGCPDLTADEAQLPLVANPGDGRSDWDVLRDDLSGLYRTILDGMAPGGRLLVLTYPLPFPERPGACPTGFGFVNGEQAGLVNAIITRLDATIVAAAEDVRAGIGGETASDRAIEVLDWRTPQGAPEPSTVRTDDGREVASGWNPAGICGVEPMLNGLRFDAEVGDSFHPSDRGLDLAAELVAGAVRAMG